ncbi:MAG: hypothetical protein CFE34_09230 [Rhodobacteraceae bacterium PARR1]|nr:MAG: hypothetical protein CFE34_09230 [Rhodobacteraceae bacterium PARR1]
MATNAIVVQQKVGRVADLLERRYGLRGQTLAERVQRGRRKMPSDLRRAAERLAQAESMTWQPKLLLSLDDNAIDRDYRLIVKRLESADKTGGMVGQMVSSATSAVLSLALLGLGIVGWSVLH